MLSLLVGIVIYAMAFALITFTYRHFSAKKRNKSSLGKESSAATTCKKSKTHLYKYKTDVFLLLTAAVLMGTSSIL